MHVIGTAGHVDHGKSTLVERLTGIDPDRFAEEKRRGLTIDLGFGWLRLPSGNEIGLIDVPGHERFIKNMLAGAGGSSLCLFVVAANEGWRQQSAEHLAILDILGVTTGVVALTKIDTVDDDAVELTRADVQERIAGSSLRDAPVIPCSAVTGKGLEELLAALDEIVAQAPPVPDVGRPRLWVDRVFTVAGAGTVLTGTLSGGALELGDEVEISPEGRKARVRSIESHKRSLERIEPGNRTALNLAGLERQGAERGDGVVKVKQWRATRTVDARIRVVDPTISGREHTLTEKGAHLLYLGTAETPVRLKLLDRGKLLPGEEGFAQLVLRDALPVARGDRFVLRDAGRVLTFGGGVVLDPLPLPARRGDADRVGLLRKIDGADDETALAALVAVEGRMDKGAARLRTGVATTTPEVLELGTDVVSRVHFNTLAERLRGELAHHHADRPLEKGMPRELARAALEIESEGFGHLIAMLPDVIEEGTTLRLDSHEIQMSAEQKRARGELIETIESSGFNPPLAKQLGANLEILRALEDAGDLVRVGDFFVTASQAAEARRLVRTHIEESGPMTVAEIRDLLRTSRKYAVPLCEWLDATGATVRRGDVRVLGPNP